MTPCLLWISKPSSPSTQTHSQGLHSQEARGVKGSHASWRSRDLTRQDLGPLKDAAALGSAGHGHPVGHVVVLLKGGDLLGDNLVLLQFLGLGGKLAPRPSILRDVVI